MSHLRLPAPSMGISEVSSLPAPSAETVIKATADGGSVLSGIAEAPQPAPFAVSWPSDMALRLAVRAQTEASRLGPLIERFENSKRLQVLGALGAVGLGILRNRLR